MSIQQEFENANHAQLDVYPAPLQVLAINVTQQHHLLYLDRLRTQPLFVLRSVIQVTLLLLMETVQFVRQDALNAQTRLSVHEFNKDLCLIRQRPQQQSKVSIT